MNFTGGTLFKIFEKLNIFYMRDSQGEFHLKEIDENGDLRTVIKQKNELSEESKQMLGVAYNFQDIRKEKNLIAPWIIE